MTRLKREVRGLKQPEWDDMDVLEKLKSCVVRVSWSHLSADVLDAEAMTEQTLLEAQQQIERLRAWQKETAKAWNRLVASKEEEIERWRAENAGLRTALDLLNRPIDG